MKIRAVIATDRAFPDDELEAIANSAIGKKIFLNFAINEPIGEIIRTYLTFDSRSFVACEALIDGRGVSKDILLLQYLVPRLESWLGRVVGVTGLALTFSRSDTGITMIEEIPIDME